MSHQQKSDLEWRRSSLIVGDGALGSPSIYMVHLDRMLALEGGLSNK